MALGTQGAIEFEITNRQLQELKDFADEFIAYHEVVAERIRTQIVQIQVQEGVDDFLAGLEGAGCVEGEVAAVV